MLAAASWTVGNLLHEVAAARAPGRVVRLRYEDLRDRPDEELTRLGHSLGDRIHSNGVNLDGFETRDTRKIIPGVGSLIESPENGVRTTSCPSSRRANGLIRESSMK